MTEEIKTWIETNEAICVHSDSDQPKSTIWLKSDPVTKDFCYRLTQLQVVTRSAAKSEGDVSSAGSWTWFEVAILASPNDESPRSDKNGNELVWRSHNNPLGQKSAATNFGTVFDRRRSLLMNLEVS
jgi:hypothetical protein